MSSPVQLITPRRHGDSRGWFSETYNLEAFRELGIDCVFVQDNHSLSVCGNTLRGLHFQTPPFAQAKLVRCIRGRIFDVAVDIRRGSPTYGRSVSAELSAENGSQLFLPIGFAHGFLSLEANSEICYKCSATYSPAQDAGICWDTVAVDWPLVAGMPPHLSDKDRRLPALADYESPFVFDGHPLEPIV